jgi:proline dehydrogenase
LIPLGSAIRLVKGAYLEPPEIAYPKKADVDENFYKLSQRLLSERRAAPAACCTSRPTTRGSSTA